MNWQPAKSDMRNTVAVILLGLAPVFVGRAHSQDLDPSLSKDHPLFEVNLRRFGYDESQNHWRLDKSIDFTDSARLAVAWVTIDDGIIPKPFKPKPAQLHVLVLDATTGRKQGLQGWATPSAPVRFLGDHDGMFLTRTGDVIRLLSPSFEVIREQNLATDPNCLNPGAICGGLALSASRRVLLLSRHNPGANYTYQLVDSDTFAPLANWSENIRIADISERWLIGYCGERPMVCTRGIDQSWQPFQPNGLGREMTDAMRAVPQFVNATTLLIAAWNKMAVATVDGSVLFKMDLPKNRSFGKAVTSSGGERFALIENRLRGVTNEFLDMSAFPAADRVVVYSIPDRRAIYAVKVKGNSPWPPWVNHVNQLALSPDGSLLAVVSDGILKIYRLPDRKS
jgi:hypothetical protein